MSLSASGEPDRAWNETARAYGIATSYVDARGTLRPTSTETMQRLLHALGADASDASDESQASAPSLAPVIVLAAGARAVAVGPVASPEVAWRIELEDGGERSGRARATNGQIALPPDVPFGYHRLIVGASIATLIVAPAAAWVPPAYDEPGEHAWGCAVQLYLLRSHRNWGIGDFTDLLDLVHLLAARGAHIVGLNPLHALFLDEPERASPYSPASRLMLNALSIDVEAVPGFASSPGVRARIAEPAFQARLAAARARATVDYTSVAELKLPILRIVFAERTADEPSFIAFVRDGGETLRRGCLFQALRDFFVARDGVRDWHAWPAEARDPHSAWTATFARDHERDIAFFAWLQWIADEQLAAAARAASGMRVGLFRDLAVGADAAGAEPWSNPHAIVDGVTVGAPPDIYNPAGQNWGLPPYHPLRLREEGYRSFIELVRANMRHAGAIRIDHAMGLARLYLIPSGASPAGGAFVAYPIDDLIAILALESHRNRCLVIGEDLGTVPDGFRERAAAARLFSYRVTFFETDPDDGSFVAPDAYPRASLAVLGSHDLPTLRAWWSGADIDLKVRLGLYGADDERDHRAQRARERVAFRDALLRAGVLAPDAELNDATLFDAAHAFLARTRSFVQMAQLDDITGEVEPVNVPATGDERNWRRRYALPLEALAGDARFVRFAERFAAGAGPRAAV